jgi:thiol:disulfide interchange protein DsbC
VISPSPIPGLYEVVAGAQIMYVSIDGRYLLQGDLYDLDHRENLTESTRATQRKKLIDGVDESTMIIFKPENKKVKHKITVFTDIDCGYCRKLHREIQTYLDEGIEIRYLAFPRSGANTKSYYKAVTVWCSDDRKAAITEAKSGTPQPRKDCKNPVLKHMDLADRFGVSGTPTIVMDNGDVVPGYVPAKRLAAMLSSGE